MTESVAYSTKNLRHYDRMGLGCYHCKHCYVSMESENGYQCFEALYMHCEIDKIHVDIGFTECSEFEQREEVGVWR